VEDAHVRHEVGHEKTPQTIFIGLVPSHTKTHTQVDSDVDKMVHESSLEKKSDELCNLLSSSPPGVRSFGRSVGLSSLLPSAKPIAMHSESLPAYLGLIKVSAVRRPSAAWRQRGGTCLGKHAPLETHVT